MPDISMCLGRECRLREKCYRYMAVPAEHWQSYANFDEMVSSDGECDAFYEIGGRRTVKKEGKNETTQVC